jgi:hypothetical protein
MVQAHLSFKPNPNKSIDFDLDKNVLWVEIERGPENLAICLSKQEAKELAIWLTQKLIE